jgi:hypothetical protein
VYIDAEKFTPTVGTVVLLRGSVMQKFGSSVSSGRTPTLNRAAGGGVEIMLNAYPRLKEAAQDDTGAGTVGGAGGGERGAVGGWFIDDEPTLRNMGFDIQGMKRWWEHEKEKRRKSQSQSLGQGQVNRLLPQTMQGRP